MGLVLTTFGDRRAGKKFLACPESCLVRFWDRGPEAHEGVNVWG